MLTLSLLARAHTETIVDFDRVVVLRAGRIVEFDTPLALLDKPEGAFRDMVEATGNFDALKKAAAVGRERGAARNGTRERGGGEETRTKK